MSSGRRLASLAGGLNDVSVVGVSKHAVACGCDLSSLARARQKRKHRISCNHAHHVHRRLRRTFWLSRYFLGLHDELRNGRHLFAGNVRDTEAYKVTALFALTVMVLGFMTTKKHWRIIVAPIVIFLLFQVYQYRQAIYSAKGIRLRMWAAAFDYMDEKKQSIWTGFGPGSYELYGPTIGVKAFVGQPNLYSSPWLHNDWLQILWEYGAIIFLLSVTFYVYLLFKSFHRPNLFCTILGYGACMCFYSPLHFMLSQLMACILIVKCIKEKPHGKSEEKSKSKTKKEVTGSRPVRGGSSLPWNSIKHGR